MLVFIFSLSSESEIYHRDIWDLQEEITFSGQDLVAKVPTLPVCDFELVPSSAHIHIEQFWTLFFDFSSPSTKWFQDTTRCA